jgi:hypothetical protein
LGAWFDSRGATIEMTTIAVRSAIPNADFGFRSSSFRNCGTRSRRSTAGEIAPPETAPAMGSTAPSGVTGSASSRRSAST